MRTYHLLTPHLPVLQRVKHQTRQLSTTSLLILTLTTKTATEHDSTLDARQVP